MSAHLSLCLCDSARMACDLVAVLSRQMESIAPRLLMAIDLHLCNTQPSNLSVLIVALNSLDWFCKVEEMSVCLCVCVCLWTQRGNFSHAKVEAFHFGLWYICRENDDLMIFQILCNRRITHVREEEEERGSLSEDEWI